MTTDTEGRPLSIFSKRGELLLKRVAPVMRQVSPNFDKRFREACTEHEAEFRRFFGSGKKGYVVIVVPYGLWFGGLLLLFLAERGLVIPKLITVERDDLEGTVRPCGELLKGNRVCVVDDNNISGATYENVKVALSSIGVSHEDILYVTWGDQKKLSDIALCPSRPASTRVSRVEERVVEELEKNGPRQASGNTGVAGSSSWRPFITSYYVEELRALKFSSREECHRAIDIFFHDRELLHVPLDIADGSTLVVPVEAVGLVRDKGLHFEIQEIVGPSSLPPEVRKQWRRDHGM